VHNETRQPVQPRPILADPERRRRYDRQLRSARARPVVVREVVVSRPFAEPLLIWHRSSFDAPRTWMTGTRPSPFDELIEELFASFEYDWFHSPRRWWLRNGCFGRIGQSDQLQIWICKYWFVWLYAQTPTIVADV